MERLREESPTLTVTQREVDIDATGYRLHTLVVRRAAPAAAQEAVGQRESQGTRRRAAAPRTLVLVHGLGGGVGLWARNLAPLAEHFDTVLSSLAGTSTLQTPSRYFGTGHRFTMGILMIYGAFPRARLKAWMTRAGVGVRPPGLRALLPPGPARRRALHSPGLVTRKPP